MLLPSIHKALSALILLILLTANSILHAHAEEETREETCQSALELTPPSSKAKLQNLLRYIGDFTIGPRFFLNKGVTLEKLEPNSSDIYAINKSNENGTKETAYFEILLPDQTVIYRSRYQVGGYFSINTAPLRRDVFKFLKQRNLENTPIIIRDVHTHPPIYGSQIISSADVKTSLFMHAILEIAGYKNFQYETSILYFGLLDSVYHKKTITMPANSISYKNGDFSLGTKLDKYFQSLTPEHLSRIEEAL